jgi:hypothetical protein
VGKYRFAESRDRVEKLTSDDFISFAWVALAMEYMVERSFVNNSKF